MSSWGGARSLEIYDTLAINIENVTGNGAFQHPSMPDKQSATEQELAELIVTSLNLEGVSPVSIDPEAALFGSGLGLDSIDALELALAISKKYGLQMRSDDESYRRVFASLRDLAAHIRQNRKT